MKNKMRRKDFIKPMRRLSIISICIVIVSLIVGLFFGDLLYNGLYVLLFGLAVFIVLQSIIFRMMRKCRCLECDYAEVFKTKYMVVTDVKDICPKCHKNLNIDEIVVQK